MDILFFILILFVLYTLGFVIPAQLKDISKQLEDIKDIISDKNRSH